MGELILFLILAAFFVFCYFAADRAGRYIDKLNNEKPGVYAIIIIIKSMSERE